MQFKFKTRAKVQHCIHFVSNQFSTKLKISRSDNDVEFKMTGF